jgi:hypothetical protein
VKKAENANRRRLAWRQWHGVVRYQQQSDQREMAWRLNYCKRSSNADGGETVCWLSKMSGSYQAYQAARK